MVKKILVKLNMREEAIKSECWSLYKKIDRKDRKYIHSVQADRKYNQSVQKERNDIQYIKQYRNSI
jgi:hypothetical protein